MEAGLAIFLGGLSMIGVICLMIAATLLKGWVLSILWGWFAVPILGLPPLGVAQAIGIALLIGMLTHQYVPSKEKDTWLPITTAALSPLIALLIGWIIKGYMA